MQRLIRARHTGKRMAIALGLAALLYAGLLILLRDKAVAQAEQPPSLLLIEEAVHQGELDRETALIYKTYTVFAPDRLPPEFWSKTPSHGATLILLEVLREWDTLSPETRTLLSEYVPASFVSGLAAPSVQSRPSLASERTLTTTHFIIHYTVTGTDRIYNPQIDTDPANGVPDYVDWVAEDLEATWNAEIGTMGWLAPPPDAGEGGDTRYDVYLKNLPGYYGWIDPAGGLVGDNPNSPGVVETDAYYSYMALENDLVAFPGDRRENIQITVAHEFNHAIQVGYDGNEALWMMEATAAWMEDEVYDTINDNYQFLSELFLDPDVALDTDQPAYWYGRWIFMRYVSEHDGGSVTVRHIWEHAVTADNVDAVRAALSQTGTSLESVFPRFAAANYVLSPLPQNAPYTYEEADGYRDEVGSIGVEAFLPFTGTTVAYDSFSDGNEHLVERHGAEYWVVSSTTSFEVTFEGHDPGVAYVVQGALREGDLVTVKQVPLTGQSGRLVVYDPLAYDQCVIVVANAGDIDETTGYSLTLRPTTETPPTAVLTITPASGSVATQFELDASASSDTQTASSELEVRWDWEGDHLWDTDWSATKTASRTFHQPGAYTVTVEIRDNVDLRSMAARTVQVQGHQAFLPVVLSSYALEQ